ncbi:MAG: hypothetical protein V4544_03885 [Pseudomonadota bacterium]
MKVKTSTINRYFIGLKIAFVSMCLLTLNSAVNADSKIAETTPTGGKPDVTAGPVKETAADPKKVAVIKPKAVTVAEPKAVVTAEPKADPKAVVVVADPKAVVSAESKPVVAADPKPVAAEPVAVESTKKLTKNEKEAAKVTAKDETKAAEKATMNKVAESVAMPAAAPALPADVKQETLSQKALVPAIAPTTEPVVDLGNKSVVPTAEPKKDVPGLQEAIKIELMAELKEVIKKQVKDEVSSRMVNLNVPASITSIPQADAQIVTSENKDDAKGTVQKSTEVAGHKTACNMFTVTTCGENAACTLHNKFCRTNCVAIANEGSCIAASDCEWAGAFKKSCDFKK